MDSSLLNASLVANDKLPYINCNNYFKYALFGSVLSAIFFILGLPVTLLILWELCKKSHQKGSNSFFMINTVIVNLAYLLIVPFSVGNSMVWHYRPFECIDSLMDSFILCSRPLFMSCVCVDCYFAVVHPIAYRTNKKMVIRKAAAVIVWLSTMAFFSHKCAKMFIYPPPLNSGPLLFSLPVIIFCDVTVLRALRKTDASKRTIHPQKKRALHTIFSSLVLTSVVYIPPVIIFSLANMMPMNIESYDCMVMVFGFMFSMSGCVIMPVLYLETIGKLDNLKDLLKKYTCF
ncbi:G-protein coupled receptor 35-like [Silurus asotus]|uniref:G-protein coupled receptor 35-like n=1 Tax=Silurus asotus TaxID=30991 RepID=A0AAD5FQ79_SILAS|nr:G-protein coupled receptor 35-like [Silurus asotus]